MTIVAECGQNFCGDLGIAFELIDSAKENGADLVKFQLYDHDKLYADHPEIPNVELSKQSAFELFRYGQEEEIEVFFSVFDVERVAWCEEMGVKRYKIAYSQRNNIKLRLAVLHTNALDIWVSGDNFYCVPTYPAPLKNIFIDVDFDQIYDGFSDHTIGLDAAKIAFARGAQIVEKHFAIDHHTGVDAPWSMTPEELAELKRFENVCKEVL